MLENLNQWHNLIGYAISYAFKSNTKEVIKDA